MQKQQRPEAPEQPCLLGRVVRAKSLHLLALVVLGGYALSALLRAMGGPEEIQAEWGFGTVIVLVPVHAILAVSPAPSEILAVTYGAMYGFLPACCLAWAGWMLAAGLEYALFRRASAELHDLVEPDRLPKWLRQFPVAHPVFLIAGRWLPLGSHLVNAAAGAGHVPIWRFTWSSALALIPISVIVAAAGAEFGARYG